MELICLSLELGELKELVVADVALVILAPVLMELLLATTSWRLLLIPDMTGPRIGPGLSLVELVEELVSLAVVEATVMRLPPCPIDSEMLELTATIAAALAILQS